MLLAVVFAVSCAAKSPSLTPFKTDGCTFFPDGDWVECCIEHDKEYWEGGSYEERVEADKKLAACVESKGHSSTLSGLMYFGVRAGGPCLLPLPFRWGYGHPWPSCE